MVNSSWTQAHINNLLGICTPSVRSDRSRGPNQDKGTYLRSSTSSTKASSKIWDASTHIVYPPCDTASLSALPLEPRERLILSVAQFRPEKEHLTQLLALAAFAQQQRSISGSPSIKLIMAGSVRNDGDEARVAGLRNSAKRLGITVSGRFCCHLSV